MAYSNPHLCNTRRNAWHFFLWMVGYYNEKVDPQAPPYYRFPAFPKPYDATLPSALWVNHSTYLIHIQGHHFLTDPIWSERCSPLPYFGPRRQHPPGLALSDLPTIDCVLISHDHYDHLDRMTVEKLLSRYPNICWVVPRGLGAWFKRLKAAHVVELNWWEEKILNSAFKITCVPAQHFSGRLRVNTTLWCGYVVEELSTAKKFYFAGDTGYNSEDFKQIGSKWKSIDLALIPIGTYCPRKFMSSVHIEPQDAVSIHREVGSRLSLAMHWKTFRLSDEPMHQPPFDLYRALRKANIHPHSFLALEPGQRVNW